jgi:hypothetical protein
MKGTLIALAALSLLSVVTPASAQDGWRDRDYRWSDRDNRWGDNDWRRHNRSGITVDVGRSYGRSDCAVRVTKIQRPNGTMVTRRVRSCE